MGIEENTVKHWPKSYEDIKDEEGYDIKKIIQVAKYQKNQHYGFAGAARVGLLAGSVLSTAAFSVFSLGTLTPYKIAACISVNVALDATLNSSLRHYYYQDEFIERFLKSNKEDRDILLEEIISSKRCR